MPAFHDSKGLTGTLHHKSLAKTSIPVSAPAGQWAAPQHAQELPVVNCKLPVLGRPATHNLESFCAGLLGVIMPIILGYLAFQVMNDLASMRPVTATCTTSCQKPSREHPWKPALPPHNSVEHKKIQPPMITSRVIDSHHMQKPSGLQFRRTNT